MTPTDPTGPRGVSRRTVLRNATLISGGGVLMAAGLAVAPSLAKSTKLPPAAVGYQSHPMGRARCDNCSQWESPSSCKVVTGVLKPDGWCSLYGPKA